VVVNGCGNIVVVVIGFGIIIGKSSSTSATASAVDCVVSCKSRRVESVAWDRWAVSIGFSVFSIVCVVVGVVVGSIIGKSSSTSSAASAVDCVSGVMLLRVDAVAVKWRGAKVSVFLVGSVFSFVCIVVVVFGFFVVGGGFVVVVGVVCWGSVLSCWVSVLVVGPGDQEKMLRRSASRSTRSGGACDVGAVVVSSW